MFSWNGFEPICQTDVPLSGHTSYRLGGPARYCFTPGDESDLAALLRRCNDLDVSWRVLGGGSNLLVRDQGVSQAVIKLGGASFEATEYRDGVLSAGSAVEMLSLVKHAARMGWSGLERLAGIPGTVGGGVRMNAGGRYGCVAELVGTALRWFHVVVQRGATTRGQNGLERKLVTLPAIEQVVA